MPERHDASLRDFLRPVLRRWWLVLFVVVASTVGTYFYEKRETLLYNSTTRILLTGATDPLDPSVGSLTDQAVADQAQLLTSLSVAEQVAERLGNPGQGAAYASQVVGRATPGSSLLIISASSTSAEGAASIANTFAETFIDLRGTAQRRRLASAIRANVAQLARVPRGAGNNADRASLQDTLRQLRVSLATNSGAGTQVDRAVPPGAAYTPRPRRTALFALVISLIGVVALIYVLDLFDRRPRRVEDAAELYGLPVLGVLPRVARLKSQINGRPVVDGDLREPIRQVRTGLELAMRTAPIKSLLVTSALKEEGKTTVVRDLALILQEGGLRVAVVDADLRRPALSARFGHPEGASGLSEVLTGRVSLDDALVPLELEVPAPNALARVGGDAVDEVSDTADFRPGSVSLLPAGPQPLDPQAVLNSTPMSALIDRLEAEFDIVLIDSAPVLQVTDAVPLAARADAVVVVARLNKISGQNARRIPKLLATISGVRPIGLIVNDVTRSERSNYGYGYGAAR